MAVAALIVGSFRAILDTSIVSVAIPRIESALSVNTVAVEWVVTA